MSSQPPSLDELIQILRRHAYRPAAPRSEDMEEMSAEEREE